MSRIEDLEKLVRELYETHDPSRAADWADWLYGNHVFVVADNATKLAKRLGANEELSRAAAMLHDIADVKMDRFDKNHEQESLNIAADLMKRVGYSQTDIDLVVNDAIKYHSCHDGQSPKSAEGKILAAADALAHLQTDFYIFAIRNMDSDKTLDDIKQWALKKLDRDYNSKIQFDEIRAEAKQDYEGLKRLFSY